VLGFPLIFRRLVAHCSTGFQLAGSLSFETWWILLQPDSPEFRKPWGNDLKFGENSYAFASNFRFTPCHHDSSWPIFIGVLYSANNRQIQRKLEKNW